MADAARRIDRIAATPAWTQADADRLNAHYAAMPTEAMLTDLLTRRPFDAIALVSSFGAESAVLLHLVAQIDAATPLIFVNTQRMFGETLAYGDLLTERLGFTDLRVQRPDPHQIAARDAKALRWSYDPDGCCALRKSEPLARALSGFDAWISGRKAFQADTRAALPRFEVDDGRLKVNPLADWDKDRIAAYFTDHDLPPHPLVEQGYPSIGCSPCTSRVQPGEDPRAGRWRGWDKVECGIHAPPTNGADDSIF